METSQAETVIVATPTPEKSHINTDEQRIRLEQLLIQLDARKAVRGK